MDKPELPQFRVLDLPFTTTADEAAQLMNAFYSEGYYVAAVVPWGEAARVFARRYSRKPGGGVNS
jgi:hypothetical protein